MSGSNLGSALFRMVLICHEMHALLPRRWEGFLAKHCPWEGALRGVRFVDDLRVYMVAPQHIPLSRLREVTYALLSFVYPAHIPFNLSRQITSIQQWDCTYSPGVAVCSGWHMEKDWLTSAAMQSRWHSIFSHSFLSKTHCAWRRLL